MGICEDWGDQVPVDTAEISVVLRG
jgi:hypothetical protein